MACRPPCCKRDPERQCAICFTDQTWSFEADATIEWRNAFSDLLKDGTGDAATGTCGDASGRDGSDGYDSHTYIVSDKKGDYFNLIGTEKGDSLTRPARWTDTYICNQLFGKKVYSIGQVYTYKGGLGSPDYFRTWPIYQTTATGNRVYDPILSGEFYIPSAPILAGEYTKTFKFRVGGDRAGGLQEGLWDLNSSSNPPFDASLEAQKSSNLLNDASVQTLATWSFTFERLSKTPLGVQNRNPYIWFLGTGDKKSTVGSPTSLNNRPVYLNLPNSDTIFDTYEMGTLGKYLNGGIYVEIKVTQTSVTPTNLGGGSNSQPLYIVGADVEWKVPQYQIRETRQGFTKYVRCQNGLASLTSRGSHKISFAQRSPDSKFEPVQGAFTLSRVSARNANWWVNDTNLLAAPDKEFLFLIPWINHFEVSDGTFTDDPTFVVSSFEHTDSGGVRKLYKTASDYGDVTIPDATTIDVGKVETGDLFKLVLDNEGEQTTEVTITYDDPFITAVDDASPTLSPYEVQTVTFTGAELTVNGTADIVLTHDQDGELIPSPWTLTLSGTAPDGPGAGGI